MEYNFPLYAYYRGSTSKIFKDGEILQFKGTTTLDNVANKTYYKTLYKALYKELKPGYAEYMSIATMKRGVVHIDELEEYK